MSAASTYSRALFEAALDRNELEQTLEDLQVFDEDLQSSEELRLFFYGTHVTEAQKRRAIDALAERSTLSARNFLKVLVDNSREESFEDILVDFEARVDEHLRKTEVEVTTAVALSEEQLGRIKSRLENMLEGRRVILRNQIQPDILGGVIFRFGGRMIDGSVRGRLRSLGERMVERGVV